MDTIIGLVLTGLLFWAIIVASTGSAFGGLIATLIILVLIGVFDECTKS
jgi:hypothetical protein